MLRAIAAAQKKNDRIDAGKIADWLGNAMWVSSGLCAPAAGAIEGGWRSRARVPRQVGPVLPALPAAVGKHAGLLIVVLL